MRQQGTDQVRSCGWGIVRFFVLFSVNGVFCSMFSNQLLFVDKKSIALCMFILKSATLLNNCSLELFFS